MRKPRDKKTREPENLADYAVRLFRLLKPLDGNQCRSVLEAALEINQDFCVSMSAE